MVPKTKKQKEVPQIPCGTREPEPWQRLTPRQGNCLCALAGKLEFVPGISAFFVRHGPTSEASCCMSACAFPWLWRHTTDPRYQLFWRNLRALEISSTTIHTSADTLTSPSLRTLRALIGNTHESARQLYGHLSTLSLILAMIAIHLLRMFACKFVLFCLKLDLHYLVKKFAITNSLTIGTSILQKIHNAWNICLLLTNCEEILVIVLLCLLTKTTTDVRLYRLYIIIFYFVLFV